MRPPTRLRRGGGGGGRRPPPTWGFRRRGVAYNTPLPRDISFQEKSRGRMSKRKTQQRMWKVKVKLV